MLPLQTTVQSRAFPPLFFPALFIYFVFVVYLYPFTVKLTRFYYFLLFRTSQSISHRNKFQHREENIDKTSRNCHVSLHHNFFPAILEKKVTTLCSMVCSKRIQQKIVIVSVSNNMLCRVCFGESIKRHCTHKWGTGS